MDAKISILILLFIVCIDGQEANADDCEPMEVHCTCVHNGTINNVHVLLDSWVIEAAPGDKIKCNYSDAEEKCREISCKVKENSTGSSALNDPFVYEVYPKVFTYPRDTGRKHISKRYTGPCATGPLKNAVVKCWKWPAWVQCEIKCAYGYGMHKPNSGTLTGANINCVYKENKWTPHEFSDCSPYLNCKAHLITPGSLLCREDIDKPASCDISCMEYEDKKEVPLKTYPCTDTNYGEQLPHCAIMEKKSGLIEKP